MESKKQRVWASSSGMDARSTETPQVEPSRSSASSYEPFVQSGYPRNPPTQAEPSYGSTPYPNSALSQTPQAQSGYYPTQQSQYAFFPTPQAQSGYYPTQQSQYAFFPTPQAQSAYYPTHQAQSSYYPTAQAQAEHYRNVQSVSSYNSFGHSAYASYPTTQPTSAYNPMDQPTHSSYPTTQASSSYNSTLQPVYPYPPTTRPASAFAAFPTSTQPYCPTSQAVPLFQSVPDVEGDTKEVVEDAEGDHVEEVPDTEGDHDEEIRDAEGDYEEPDGESSAPAKPTKRKAYARVSATRITADDHAFLDRLVHLCGPESQGSPTSEQLAASLGCTRTNVAKRLGKALEKVVGKGAYKVFKTLKLAGYAPNGGAFNMGTLIRHVRTHGVNRSYLVAYQNGNYRKPVKPSQSVLDIEAGARRQR